MTTTKTTIGANYTNFEIEGAPLIMLNNVVNYHHHPCRPFLDVTYQIKNDPTPPTLPTNYYIMDCNGFDAFGHWFFESFIFFENILLLNKHYNNIKIVTYNRHKFVKSLLKFHNIHNEIVYVIDTPNNPEEYNVVKTPLPDKNNRCFFPMIFSLNDWDIDAPFFRAKIMEMNDSIHAKTPTIPEWNPLTPARPNILLLPRNATDNYKSNDRTVDGMEYVEYNVINIGGTVLNTYQLNNFHIQTCVIKNSDIIILDFGSSFIVNCFYLSGKKIIVINNMGLYEPHGKFPANKIIFDMICSNNEVIVINKSVVSFKDDIRPHLEGLFEG
jgi:hypothetical protein